VDDWIGPIIAIIIVVGLTAKWYYGWQAQQAPSSLKLCRGRPRENVPRICRNRWSLMGRRPARSWDRWWVAPAR
jgi:hypothetical protein